LSRKELELEMLRQQVNHYAAEHNQCPITSAFSLEKHLQPNEENQAVSFAPKKKKGVAFDMGSNE